MSEKKQPSILSFRRFVRTVNGVTTSPDVVGIPGKNHRCQQCSKGFSNKGNLASHMMWVHKMGRKEIVDTVVEQMDTLVGHVDTLVGQVDTVPPQTG